ncbi:unnamed protein product [Pneumocystis jirovecii]|uniref:60S ribosomal protein L16 n=1 Tax=Pneumocystis jirovecii TaxID=42068 RepID=L0P9Y2_PNEJI|nr:unnamed protein product [Pneumocystis jirovecii]
MFTQENIIVIDGKCHLLGRLASVVAKQLLSGQKIRRVKMHAYLHKRTRFNPARGPFHFRAPSRVMYKAIRGMIPHKTARGAAALERLKVFEGIPPPYDKQKRLVVPSALRALRLKPGRKFCTIGRLSKEIGWKYENIISELENKRKTRSHAYYVTKITKEKSLLEAKKNAPTSKVLEKFGY